MELLKGKVALITGAGRGIGKSIALTFAAQGADIAFTDLKIGERELATLAQLEALGVKAKAYASDCSSFDGTQAVVKQIHQDFGRVDILVNNAGITQDTLLIRMDERQWDAVLDVNLKGAFNFIRALSPIMMKQRGGNIINISSVVGLSGNVGQANYSASKAGLVALAKSVAKELGSRGIRANAVAPGFIVTEMTGALSEDLSKAWMERIPLRRAGTPQDIANTCLFLASDLSSYISGQVITVCGGMHM